jgi:hypothetical protein
MNFKARRGYGYEARISPDRGGAGARLLALGHHAGWFWVRALEDFRHHGALVAAGDEFCWSEQWLVKKQFLMFELEGSK